MNINSNHLLIGCGVLLLLNLNQRGREAADDAATADDDLNGVVASSKGGGFLDELLKPVTGGTKSKASHSKSPRAWLDTYDKVDRHDAAQLASRLHIAFDGLGTDNDEVSAVAAAMALKHLPFKLVAWYYEAAFKTDLTADLSAELSGDEFTKFMNTVPTK